MASRRIASASRDLVRHTCAQPKNTRWTPVKPSMHRGALAVQRQLVGEQRDGQSTQVADVLSHGERAIDVLAVLEPAGRVDVVLLDERLGADAEFGAVVVGPPVDQVAVAVVLGTLVVEAVSDLVADHRADTAVVRGVVDIGVEERWLQNACGKDDFVHPRVVVGVDGLRGHEPLVAIDRPAQLGQLPVGVHGVAAPVVAVQVAAVDDQRRVVSPLLGIGDFGGELVQLGQRALPGLRGHPVQVADADAVCLAEIGDQRVDACLGIRREMALDVELSDGVAQHALHQSRPRASSARGSARCR